MAILKRVLAFMLPHWRRALAGYLCLTIVQILNVNVPRFIREGIDQGLTAGSNDALVRAVVIIVGLALVKSVFGLGHRYLIESVSMYVDYEIRNAFYDRVQNLSFAYHDKAQTGQLMARATSDVNSVVRFLGHGLTTMVNLVIVSVAVLYMAISFNWQLALLALLPMPLVGVVAVVFGRVVRRLVLRMQQQFAVMTAALQENFTGVRVVKAFAREDFELDKFSKESELLRKRRMEVTGTWAFSFPLMVFLSGLSIAIIILYGGSQVIAGATTIGTLVAMQSYVLLLQNPVRHLGFSVNMTARAIASGERIFEILDAKSPVREAPNCSKLTPVKGHVRFDNVSFAYTAKEPVLRDICFEAKPGQLIALMGTTGSGKSTIVNLIPRFYDVTKGRVTIDGTDVRDVTLESLRRQIGIVQQESFLFSATIQENIAYGVPSATLADVERAAKVANIHDFIVSLPNGYQTEVGERGVNLSGGQKQRMSIARALLLNPPLLILDDSTSSVDTETEYQIQQALQTLMQNRTTFVIAQRLTTVRDADLILVLDEGQIVQRGRHDDLIAQDGLYRRIYDLQLRDQEEMHESRRRGQRAAEPVLGD